MKFRFLVYFSWISIGIGLLGLFVSVLDDASGAHDPLFQVHFAESIAMVFLAAILRVVLAIEENTRRP